VRKDDYDLFPTHLAEKYRRDDAAVLASRKVFEDVEEHRQPNGETIYVQVLKSSVYDAHGNVVAFRGCSGTSRPAAGGRGPCGPATRASAASCVPT